MGATTSRRAHGGAQRPGAVVALVLVLVATAAGLLAAATPLAAAPPAATHSGLVDPNPIDSTPHILDGRTEAVLDLGSTVIVGGSFTQVKRPLVAGTTTRTNLFAYDKATGAISATFDPRPDGKVTSLLRAPDGKVLVGGQFRSIGGRSLSYLAKLDPTTGAVITSFRATPDGFVDDMHIARGHLYLGGSFARVSGTARGRFAAVDPATGALRSANVTFDGAAKGANRITRLDVTPDGTRLVAIGNFARVGGQARADIAMLSLTASGGATVASWATPRYGDDQCGGFYDTFVYDVDISPDGRWFVVVTSGGPWGTTRLCDTAARWEITGAGSAPTWVNWTGGDSLTSVAITGPAVYVAGHNRWLDNPQGRDTKGPGAVDRPGIGALSPTTGRALSWNPTRERGLQSPRMVPTAEGGLYVLSDSSTFAGEWHPRLTYLTLTGRNPGEPPPTNTKPTAPGMPTVSAATATTATVDWAAPASPGSSAITQYTVTAQSGSTVLGTRTTGTARSTTFPGLPAGRRITFTVTARNAAGTGPASAASAAAVLPFRSVDAFTEQQHRDVLGRGPTGIESADWESRISAGTLTPGAAVDALLRTDAADDLAGVVRLYEAYFLRAPDAGGFRYWRDEVRRGRSLDQISQSFAASPEFRTLYGSLSDTDFVRLVYENVLDRAPDRAGLDYWVGRLRAGVTRGKAMTGFSESPENRAATQRSTDVTLLVHLLLDRAPTAAERTSMEAQLAGGTARSTLAQALLTGAEYDRRV